jgi:hypothetical protein
MPTPHEEIELFLAARGIDPDRAVAVAREFARCMCDELRDALAAWESETSSLADGPSATSLGANGHPRRHVGERRQ